MTVISSREFATRQKKYYDLALNEQVCIKRGRNMFHLTYNPATDEDDDNDELLALAKSRMNDEFTSGEEYRNFLNKLINEPQSSKKGL